MAEKNSSCVCKAHSGIASDIEYLKTTNKSQWKEINGMKKFIMATLLLACLTLVGVLFQIVITMAQGRG